MHGCVEGSLCKVVGVALVLDPNNSLSVEC